MTDSNQVITTAQAAVQGLVDTLRERDSALAAASAQAALAADALADMRAQNEAIRQANDALQAQLATLQNTVG